MSAPALPSPQAAPLTKLARGGVVNLAGTFVGGLAGIALVIVVTNGFPQVIAGLLFTVTSFFLIVSAVCGLGVDAGLAQLVQRSLAAGRPERAKATLWVAWRPVLALSVVLALAGWVFAPGLAGLLGADDAQHDQMTWMLRVVAVTLPVATGYDTLLSATRAYGTMRANVVVEKLGRLPLQILCVAGIWALGLGPVWLAAAWALPYLLGFALVLVAYRRIAPRAAAQPDRELNKEFWSFTAPRALGRICQVALQRADIVLVAALLSPTHAAIYTAATRFLTVGQLGTQAIQQVLQPQLAGLFARGDLAGARQVFQTSTAWLMALSWPVYLVCATFTTLLLQVFGDGYEDGRATLIILALTMLVATACGPADVALLMAGRSRQSLANNALALVTDVVLAVLLIPVLGITGAAVAWAGALLVRNALPVLQVWRAYGLLAFGRGVGWVALAAGVCFGVVPFAVVSWFGPSIVVAVITLPLMCLAYAGVLWKGRRALQLQAFRKVVPRKVRVGLSKAVLRKPGLAEVPIDRLLLGQQDGVTVQRYASETGDLLWGSTPVSEGPHVALLRLADAGPPSDAEILASPYGEHARRCLRLTGRYFWATDEAGVVEVARAFLDRAGSADGDGDGAPPAGRAGQSGPDDPILVAPVRDSDCYQVLDGHHRLALAAVRGEPSARVSVKRSPVTTPLQDHLRKMSWLGGTKELYQPIDAPELKQAWSTVRRCDDRLDKMVTFLAKRNLGTTEPAYLDVASCYGWFVAELGARGYDAYGIERDPLARTLGQAIYGVNPEQISIGDAVDLLRAAGRRWDVVSCFSLLHHFVLGRGSTTPEELVHLLDSVTGSVLFLDTGQDHERWFERSLAGWNTERVATFLRENSTFDDVIDLGPDSDNVGRYAGNYGRHLFACVRTTGR